MFDSVGVIDIVAGCAKVALDDITFLTDDDLCATALELTTAGRALEATRLRVLAELDARNTTDRDHGMNTANWLAHHTGDAPAHCRRSMRIARTCRRLLRRVDEALATGRIGLEHARVLVDAANPRIESLIAELQDELIDRATEISFDRWRREVMAITALLDHDGGHDPERDRSRTRTSIVTLFDGTTRILTELLSEDAVLVTAALNTEADRLFHRYRDDHKIDPTLTIPTRATLLALALVELCRKGLARDIRSSEPARPEIILTITTEHPDTARFLDGTTIPISELNTILHDPFWRPAFLGTDGILLDLGRTHRYASPEQRRALAVRDGGCVFPGCDHPPAWCDAHHVIWWESGGTTDMSNLALLCRHHHGVTHRNGWYMTTDADQTFTWTTPTGTATTSQRHGQRAGP